MKRFFQEWFGVVIVITAYGHSYPLSIGTWAYWGWVLLGAIGLQVYGNAYHKREVAA